MLRFVLGDELGNIKLLHYDPDKLEFKTSLKVVHRQDTKPPSSVQKLAVNRSQAHVLVSAAFSDGNCTISKLDEDDDLTPLKSWREPHISGSKFVGLSMTGNSIFTCTSSGMLRHSAYAVDDINQPTETKHASLPSHLFDWRLSADSEKFAYGGEEVDLSIWSVERTFQVRSQQETSKNPDSKKRKIDEPLPGEVWKARNLPNDHLGLRQPIRITTLAYLESSSVGHHLVTGTQFGDIRRYDTRSGRRPVSNWTKLGKVGGIRVIEKSISDHQIFIGDGGSSLYAIDLRTGAVLHGYRGISGAVTSIAPSPAAMVSTSHDRFARIHSVLATPHNAGERQEGKAEVLEKCYLNSTPTVVVWDQCNVKRSLKRQSEGEEDEIWDKLENITDT